MLCPSSWVSDRWSVQSKMLNCKTPGPCASLLACRLAFWNETPPEATQIYGESPWVMAIKSGALVFSQFLSQVPFLERHLKAFSIPGFFSINLKQPRIDTTQLHPSFHSIVSPGEEPFRRKRFLNNLTTSPSRSFILCLASYNV